MRYIQLLASAACDPDFIVSVLDEADPYFLPAIERIDADIRVREESVASNAWEPEFRVSARRHFHGPGCIRALIRGGPAGRGEMPSVRSTRGRTPRRRRAARTAATATPAIARTTRPPSSCGSTVRPTTQTPLRR